MGGTFDPVHYGHINTAKDAAARMGLSEVLFIPSGTPSHKGTSTDPNIRYSMLLEAIKGYNTFKISDIEINRSGFTYTIDTLRELTGTFGITEIIYLIGADVVRELDTWRDYKEVFKLCRFAAMQRPGYPSDSFKADIEKMSALGADIFSVEVSQMDISSRIIREKIKNKESVHGLLPEEVIGIIERERLYVDL